MKSGAAADGYDTLANSCDRAFDICPVALARRPVGEAGAAAGGAQLRLDAAEVA
jgi:hypothetical protein